MFSSLEKDYSWEGFWKALRLGSGVLVIKGLPLFQNFLFFTTSALLSTRNPRWQTHLHAPSLPMLLPVPSLQSPLFLLCRSLHAGKAMMLPPGRKQSWKWGNNLGESRRFALLAAPHIFGIEGHRVCRQIRLGQEGVTKEQVADSLVDTSPKQVGSEEAQLHLPHPFLCWWCLSSPGPQGNLLRDPAWMEL